MLFPRTKNKVRRRRAALGSLSGLPTGRVLDAPCGDGALARELAALGWRTWAGDIEPVGLQRGNGVRFLRLDLEKRLPFADAVFDAVVSLEGVEHLLRPAQCLAEFCRILRPGGVLAVWSVSAHAIFSQRLENAGFAVDEQVVRTNAGRGARHIVWLATKPA